MGWEVTYLFDNRAGTCWFTDFRIALDHINKWNLLFETKYEVVKLERKILPRQAHAMRSGQYVILDNNVSAI